MFRLALCFLLACLACLCSITSAALAGDSRQGGVPDESLQLVLVVSEGWNDATGVLRRYERSKPNAQWHEAGEAWAVNLGRNGLGWGLGLVAAPSLPDEPVKHEGDGRAPAGVFALPSGFAYDPAEVSRAALRVVRATDDLVCVDDVSSKHYNTLTTDTLPDKDWNSAEHMHRNDLQYRFGVVVAHNQAPVPGAGSCIFMHVQRGPGAGTAGCTSMAAAHAQELLVWLQPEKAPVLVQLPRAAYERQRTFWNLP